MKIACVTVCVALTWLTTTGEPICHSKYDYDVKLLGKMLSMEFNYNKQVESLTERGKQMELNYSKQVESFIKREKQMELNYSKQVESFIEREKQMELNYSKQVEIFIEREKQMELNYSKQVEMSDEREKQMTEQVNGLRESLTSKLLSMEFNYNKQVESCNARGKLMNDQVTILRESSMNLSQAFGASKDETFQIIDGLKASTTSIKDKHEEDFTFLRTEIDEKFKEVAETFTGRDPVAFAVQKVDNKDAAIGEKIVYSEVLLDTDGCYDTNTGVFTAPRDGIYLFSVLLYMKDEHNIGLAIMAGGKQLATCKRGKIALYSSHSTVGVGQLQRGQQVYVVMKYRSPESGDVMYDSHAINNFQGVLLQG